MNLIWSILMCFCLVYAIITGRIDDVINSFFKAGESALKTCINVSCIIIFFNGVFNVALESGLIKKISFVFKKISKFIFKDIKNDEIIDLISLNFSACFLGLGIATTPIAFKILDKLKEEVNEKNKLIKNVFLLAVLNITSFSLFPLTVLSIREKYHSNIGITIWLLIVLITFFESLITLIIVRNMKYELFD